MRNRNHLLQELKDFFKTLKLSNYGIRVYLTLLQSNTLTAKELSKKARVPTGRIYDVLEEIRDKGMIEIQESRPKLYKAISPNLAFHGLISHIQSENQKKISSLLDQAKVLESELEQSNLWFARESPGLFWSTAFGALPVMSLFTKRINELTEEYLMTAFITEDTVRVLPLGKPLFRSILNAINRGVKVKILWSFEFDRRPVADEQKERNLQLYYGVLKKLQDLFGISSKLEGLKVKYINRRFPTYYDILDKNRVLIKLQNPLKPTQIFACLNVLDPILAKELRDKYLALWLHDAIEVPLLS